jgi:beta-lactamase regulating signal transducer with metallopeptidase domain
VLCILAVLRRRTAHVEHAAWTVVVVLMLMLPSASALLPGLRVPAPSALRRYEMPMAAPVRRITVQEPIVLNVTEGKQLTVQSSWEPARGLQWPLIITALYLAIFFALLFRLLFAVFLTARLADGSTVLRNSAANDVLKDIAEEHSIAYPLPQLSESERIRVACVVGSDTPSILLPIEWRQWDAWKLRAVLAHELTHIRRGD